MRELKILKKESQLRVLENTLALILFEDVNEFSGAYKGMRINKHKLKSEELIEDIYKLKNGVEVDESEAPKIIIALDTLKDMAMSALDLEGGEEEVFSLMKTNQGQDVQIILINDDED